MSSWVDVVARWWCRHHGVLYALFAMCCTIFAASRFYSYMLFQTHGVWSAPLDDVFIHFDYARSFARGFPFQWSEGNGYSSGDTSLTYPIALSVGYLAGFQGLGLMVWAALIAALGIFGFLVAGAMLVDEDRRWARFLLPPAVLSLGALDWTLFSGMETAFHLGVWGVCLLCALRLTLASDRRSAFRAAALLGAVGAILCATRPESGICVAAFACYAAHQGHAHGHTRGLRASAAVIALAALPAVLFFAIQAGVNYAFTNEWPANGAIAKLYFNNPFLTAADKWQRFRELLSYIVPRLLDYHFSASDKLGYLVVLAALVPLAAARTRAAALMLWAQIIGWLLLVSLNDQLRWHNERYAMPAVAWLLVLAALGVGLIASRRVPARLAAWSAAHGRAAAAWGDKIWPARVGAAALLVLLYWHGQAPRHAGQVWFFGRACRNILDQHVTAGMILKNMNARRILVGDAGALTYISDRPGLDLIGLGGYHTYPFARSSAHGLGASLELIERIPPADRPDHMAIYSSWWEDLPGFGAFLTSVPVRGNVICGDPAKELYDADWHALDRRGNPRTLLEGERVEDQLDVADLISERAHDYNFPQPGMGYTELRVLPDPADSREELFDAGRVIPEAHAERARMRAPRGSSRLIVRVAAWHPIATEVSIDGAVVGQLEAEPMAGWQELTLPLPHGLSGEFELGLRSLHGDGVTFHVWVVAR